MLAALSTRRAQKQIPAKERAGAQRRAQPRRARDAEMQPKRTPGVGWRDWLAAFMFVTFD